MGYGSSGFKNVWKQDYRNSDTEWFAWLMSVGNNGTWKVKMM